MVIEYLVGGFEAQDLTRTVIKTVSNEPDIGVRQSGKVGFLWKVLSDKAVGVLVGASLPRRIRVGKEEVGIEGFGDLLMAHELDAVVARDGKDLVFVREEFPADSVCDRFGRLGSHLLKQQEPGPPFDQREYSAFLLTADDGIDFPVAEPLARVDDRRPFAYRPPSVPTFPAAIFMGSFAVCVTPP